MSIPKEAGEVIGASPEKTVGRTATGLGITVPNDVEVARATFEKTYKTAQGNLETQQKNVNIAIDSYNILANDDSSATQKVTALASLASVVGNTAVLVAVKVGLITAKTFAATVPVIGLVVAAFVLAATAIIAFIQEYILNQTPERPHYNRPIDWAMMSIPPQMEIPNVPFNAVAILAAASVSKIIRAEWLFDHANEIKDIPESNKSSRSLSRNQLITNAISNAAKTIDDETLRLSILLGNDRGRADTLIRICSVMGNPRWQKTLLRADDPKDPSGFTPPNSFRAGSGGKPGRYVSDEEAAIDAASKWSNQFPGFTDYLIEIQALTNDPRYAAENQTRYFGEMAPQTYLCMYAAAAVVSGMKAPASFAYMMTYNLMIARSWAYKANNRPLPETELATQGYLIDLLTNTPMERTAFYDFGGPQGDLRILANRGPKLKDLRYYIETYAQRAGLLSSRIPRPLTIGPTRPDALKVPFPGSTIVRTGPIRTSGTGGTVGRILQPGRYIIDTQSERPIHPSVILDALYKAGMPSQLLHPGIQPNTFRFVGKTMMPIQLPNIQGVHWQLVHPIA